MADQAVAPEAEPVGAGYVLLRPSGTEPVIRIMVEGRDGATVRRSADRSATAVRRAAG